MKDDKEKKPAGLVIAGAAVAAALVLMGGLLFGSIRNRTKTGIIWDDLGNVPGPFAAIERFVDEHLFGFSEEEIEGRPQGGKAESANPFE